MSILAEAILRGLSFAVVATCFVAFVVWLWETWR